MPPGGTRIRADEETGTVVDDPGCELVEFAIDRIEQEHAAHAVAESADVEAPGRRHEAAAVADDDHRHVGEGLGGTGVAVEAGEVIRRLVDEALEAVLL